MTRGTVRAAIYSRISQDRAGDQLGVRRQEKECRQLAERLGWTITQTFSDDDISAYTGKRRPGFEQLLAAVESDSIDAIIAWHPDRLHRSTKELESFIDLVNAHGVQVNTVQAGEYDLSTAAGRMTARVVGAVARHESEHKAERQKAKHRELALAGFPAGGGSRPFGYNKDRWTVRPEEAELVREAARRVVGGESIRAIVRDWTDREVRTVSGVPWAPTVVRNMLVSPRIAGLRVYDGQTIQGRWEPIIDHATHLRLVAILTDPARRTQRHRGIYLLTGGIAVCGLCHAKLVARPRADKRRSYVCASGPGFGGCGKIRVLADELETEVEARVLAALGNLELPDTTEPSYDFEIARLEAARRQLAADHYADNLIDRDQFLAASQGLDKRLEGLRARINADTRRDRLRAVHADSGRLAGEWPGLSVDQKRAVLSALVERVEVGPAVRGRNFFDPDRVTVIWVV